MKTIRILRILAGILFMISLFCTVDLGLNLLFNAETQIHDGSYGVYSVLHTVFRIFGDSRWSYDRFFFAFRNSAWVTYGLLVLNGVLHFCKGKG